MIAGALIITAAGLFIFWREQAQGKTEATAIEPP
jgi:hypothetical protein